MSADESNFEAIIKQIVQPLREEIGHVRGDAREARDGMMKLTSAVENQGLGKRIEQFSADMKSQHEALRQDVVVAITNVKKDVVEVADRVKELEEERERRDGGILAVRVIRDYGGWLMGCGAAALAFYEKFAHTTPKG